MEITNKNGEISKRLQQVTTQANMEYIINFIATRLPKIIHHRNHLKHYRSTITEFRECYDNVLIDIDFSENLSIPVKFEPQSLHWHHEQVTIYSGILKAKGRKSYHPYISNDRKHDQQFVHVVLEKMLDGINVEAVSYVVIESDNCSSQYMSAKHFFSIQQLSNQLDSKVLRVFGISEHGKGEVDHVGGIAKNAIRKEIAGGCILQDASGMVDFLEHKFRDNSSPEYIVREITEEELNNARCDVALKVFKIIEGSSSFQVMLFTPP